MKISVESPPTVDHHWQWCHHMPTRTSCIEFHNTPKWNANIMVDENIDSCHISVMEHKNELHCQSRRKCTELLSPVQLSANPHNCPLGPVMTWKSPKGMWIWWKYRLLPISDRFVNCQSLWPIGSFKKNNFILLKTKKWSKKSLIF